MDKLNINFYTKFAKVDADKRMVYGYCTTESVDSQGEIVSKDAIRKAWLDYMQYANIREMHQPSAVGVTKEYAHDDVGTWIGVKVVDDNAWKKVQEGVYKGFSIGGRITLKVDNIIKGIILSEISLVDRPANPDAKISVVKIDDGLVQSLSLEAIKNYKFMKKFVEIDGVKYVEDPNKAGEALINEATGEKELYVEESAEEKPKQEEKPKEEEKSAEEEKKVEEEKPETPEKPAEEKPTAGGSEETAKPGADAGAAGEKMFKSNDSKFVEKAVAAGVLAKDTDGVLMGAGLLDHLEYIMAACATDGKDIASLMEVKNGIMKFIQAEANETEEKGVKTGDLQKMAKTLSDEFLGKVGGMIDGKLGDIAKKVDDVAKEVETIKNTKVSQRPKAAGFAVEKSFAGGAENANLSVDEAKTNLDSVRKEVDEHYEKMQIAQKESPAELPALEKRSTELFGKLREAQDMLQFVMGGGAH